MDDARVGAAFRAVRIRRGWRQADVAAKAGVSSFVISTVERGHIERMPLRTLRRVAASLDIRIDVVPRWRGADLDRLLNAGHARMHQEIASFLNGTPDWIHAPEVSFSIYGERGVIDILAFHPPTGSLLIIELKTEIVDVEDLCVTMDRRRRLADRVAQERGWDARTICTWVVLAESDSNRRRLAANRATLRSAFPDDGRRIRAWLRQPQGRVSAISFWANVSGGNTTQRAASRKRVRRPRIGDSAR